MNTCWALGYAAGVGWGREEERARGREGGLKVVLPLLTN